MLEVVKNPVYLLIILIIFLGLIKIIFKTDYFSVTNIVKEYIKGFKNDRTKKVVIIPFLIAFIIPILFAILINNIKQIDGKTIEIITIIISILTSMFFTVLALIIDIKARTKERQESKKLNANDIQKTMKLIRLIYHALMFEILLCIFILLLCFIGVFTEVFTSLLSFLIYYFTFTMLINMFMVLKRVFVIIEHEINN